VQFKYECETNVKRITLDASLPTDGREWLVWSYCGVSKNDSNRTNLPRVKIALREFRDRWVSDHIRLCSVSLTHLGQLRIGSIWKNRTQVARVIFSEKEFAVSYDPSCWTYGSFLRALQENEEPPYPLDLYPLVKKETDRNEHLMLKAAGGIKLVIPCLEYFSRMYGRTQQVTRVLATYPWPQNEGDESDRLLCYQPAEHRQNEWCVKLRSRIRNSDAVFLAHVKYDSWARLAAKNIYANLEKQYGPNKKYTAFIQVPPWFTGQSKIKVQGIWFNNRQSFLALQIIGHNDPQGPLINIYRENPFEAGETGSENFDEEATAGTSRQRKIGVADELTLTGEDDPDHGAATAEILDDDFEVLGVPRQTKTHNGEKSQGKTVSTESSNKLLGPASSGERHGSGKDTRYASMHAKQVSESNGTLLDMWNAALYLSDCDPDYINSVQSFTLETGYIDSDCNNRKPKGITFTKPVVAKRSNDSGRVPGNSWRYVDKKKDKRRGFLVMRLQCRGKSVHIIEIQRRRKIIIDGKNELVKEENFRGIVMILANDDLLPEWLTTFIAKAPGKKGVIGDFIESVPGEAAAFNHADNNSDNVPCEGAVINALSKVGITRSRD